MPYTFVLVFRTLWITHGNIIQTEKSFCLFFLCGILLNLLFFVVLVNPADTAAVVQVSAFVLLALMFYVLLTVAYMLP